MNWVVRISANVFLRVDELAYCSLAALMGGMTYYDGCKNITQIFFHQAGPNWVKQTLLGYRLPQDGCYFIGSGCFPLFNGRVVRR